MRVLIVALTALLAAGSAFAAEKPTKPAKSERSCFRASSVSGFNAVDDRTVDVTVGVSTVYRLTLFTASPDIDWTQSIGIRPRGGTWICQGMDADLIIPGSIGPSRYPVTEVRKLTPEEVAAKKQKKK